MLYRVDRTVHTAGGYVGLYGHRTLPCHTRREMRALYPNGGFLIVGESAALGPFWRMAIHSLPQMGRIYPRGSLTRPFRVGVRLYSYGRKRLCRSGRGPLARRFPAPTKAIKAGIHFDSQEDAKNENNP